MSEKEETDKGADTITEQQRELAQNALHDFNKQSFTTCLQNLNKLDGRSNDFKVAHNKAVVEFYKSDTKKVELFQKALNAIFIQFQLSLEKLDDVDHCILHFNQAVLFYHQQQYTAALRIMDRVYKFIEPMDEDLGKRVGLLITELQLCVKQPEKALGLLTYLQNQLINCNENIKILKTKGGGEKEHKEKKIAQPLNAANELFLKKLCKYRARCYLMTHMMDLAKKEMQTLSNDNNADVLFLRANLEYLSGNFAEVVKILTSVPADAFKYNDCGEDSTVLFYNNIGVAHYAMGKPNLACHYFQTALKEDLAKTQTKESNEKPLFKIGGSKYHEIVYNLGLALLQAGKPVQAFECLIVAVRRFHRNSRLWLRLAECCIMTHKQSNEVDFDLQKKQKEIVVQWLGAREMQKVVLTTSVGKDKKYSTESQSYAVPVPTLEFASLCLRNALLLLPSDAASSPVPLLLIPGVTPPAPPPSPGPAPSSPLSADEICKLKNAILVASAYVSLCLGDYILSLEHARSLLSQPKAAEGHKFLARLYAAESLVLLDEISDAIEYLNPEHVTDISFVLPTLIEEEARLKTEPPFKWFPTTTSCAVAVTQYNMAVAKSIRGQLEEASSLLSQIWKMKGPDCQIPAHILMLLLYIELKLGHADAARSLIKQYSFQQRVTA